MSKRKSPKNKDVFGQPRTASPVAVAAQLRGGAGVHADQKRRKNSRADRRDRSYRDLGNW
jgi:hypothetical protein